jgi:hypothetical protein
MALADAVLRLDANGNPRTVCLLAALMEFESSHFAEAASKSAENELVRAFRGGATPTVPSPSSWKASCPFRAER